MFSNKYNVDGRLIVITGGSQGLGYALAKNLYLKGANIIIISRTETKLLTCVEEIKKLSRKKDQFVDYVAADLSKYENCEKVREHLVLKNLLPDDLICCAGIAYPQKFAKIPISKIDEGIDINYRTAVYFVHAMLPLITEKVREQHLVLCSSVIASYAFYGYSQYAPMKAAVKAFGDCMRHELLPYGVKVHTLFPGNFESEGYAQENLTKPALTKEIEGASPAISAEKCADIVVKSLQNGSLYIYTDFIGWVLGSFSLGLNPREWWFAQIFLSFVGSLVGRLVDLYHEHLIRKESQQEDKRR
ncbi:hypothetical protein KL930_000424 [Ogataea haglerorum]|uniref:3-ketodihydrosphingosine reductase TSC10 n=1 Tax=Ogataea haglerorum TaxID=1937702 RepID=A0AAN6D4J7_9ASCO|nr:uncharacterized protein KL911_000707 [Ogataea haglerorum]KAG7697521.1 hypothetical protein KL951_002095 [Ogataea haglerorum]KAG7701123.1 hypothetical protein KL915_000154 [Ogataea haglerorum]KAG7705971.1 hypothetical protein KL950_003547 [Ogataea haglerorum]KAG7709081.1 hypothetical protein KL914_001471 [Ogataea haglerorum]KAG7726863.1 hypothetical protein KL933_003146 [Ogataea haglerorum]